MIIDNDGVGQLNERIKSPLEHLFNKLSSLEVKIDKDSKKGDSITVDAFTLADGPSVYDSVYRFLEETETWSRLTICRRR